MTAAEQREWLRAEVSSDTTLDRLMEGAAQQEPPVWRLFAPQMKREQLAVRGLGMSEVNRSIVVVKPRQPYLDWALALPDPTPVTLEHLRADCNAYLVPEILDPGDELAILQDHHAFIFERELAGWVTDVDLWPQERDLRIFTEWFDTEFHSMVFDLCEDDVLPWSADDG